VLTVLVTLYRGKSNYHYSLGDTASLSLSTGMHFLWSPAICSTSCGQSPRKNSSVDLAVFLLFAYREVSNALFEDNSLIAL